MDTWKNDVLYRNEIDTYSSLPGFILYARHDLITVLFGLLFSFFVVIPQWKESDTHKIEPFVVAAE